MAGVRWIAVGALLVACGGRALVDPDDDSTTTASTTSVADSTVTSPGTSPGTSPSTSPGTAGTATTLVDTSSAIGESDDDHGEECFSHACLDIAQAALHCDPTEDECPRGQKCVWVAESDGQQRRDDAICIPVDGEVPPFHPCSLPNGTGLDITDDCDASSYCLEVYGTADHGFCAPYMDDDLCTAYPGSQPAIENGSEFPAACLVYDCDPLAESPCPDAGMTCTFYPAFLYGSLMCWYLPPTATLALGEPCDYGQCGDGLACVPGDFLPECADERCCTQWCDLDAPVCSDPAAVCQPFPYQDDSEFSPNPRLGACTTPGVFD